MGAYAGADSFGATIYTLETTDPVLGGASGVSNTPIKNLADRTAYLKNRNDAFIGAVAAFALSTAPTGWLKANGARLTRTAYQALFDKIGWVFAQRITSPGGGSAVFTSVDRIGTTNVAHGFSTGDLMNIAEINPSGGTFVAKFGGVGADITDSTPCYVRVLSANTFSLHPTATDATNNTLAAEVTTYSVGAFVVIEYTDKFTLPDLRGEFVRGWDDGRGIDTGRVMGSTETHGTTGTDYSNIALLHCIKYE